MEGACELQENKRLVKKAKGMSYNDMNHCQFVYFMFCCMFEVTGSLTYLIEHKLLGIFYNRCVIYFLCVLLFMSYFVFVPDRSKTFLLFYFSNDSPI